MASKTGSYQIPADSNIYYPYLRNVAFLEETTSKYEMGCNLITNLAFVTVGKYILKDIHLNLSDRDFEACYVKDDSEILVTLFSKKEHLLIRIGSMQRVWSKKQIPLNELFEYASNFKSDFFSVMNSLKTKACDRCWFKMSYALSGKCFERFNLCEEIE